MTKSGKNKIDDSKGESKKCCCCNCKCGNSSDEFRMLKRSSYYQVMLDNLVSSTKDLDKQFLTLSTLGIGFVAILKMDSPHILALPAYFSFTIVMALALISMHKTPAFLRKKIDKIETPDSEELKNQIENMTSRFSIIEFCQKLFFFFGAIFTILLVLISQKFFPLMSNIIACITNLQTAN